MARGVAVIIAHFEATPTHRLIASRYPPIGVFDFMPDQEAAITALALEGATNDRLNDVANKLARMAPEDRIFGKPTAHQALAAFLHTTPLGGRFNGPELGAWYAALSVGTAVAETVYHHTRRLSLSAAGFPNSIEMRELISRPTAELVDIRELDDPAIYHLDDYSAGQEFAAGLRAADHDGILYQSVRHAKGTNVAMFKARLVVPITQGAHYRYDWDRNGKHSVTLMTAA
jgi:RES domain-containing protein